MRAGKTHNFPNNENGNIHTAAAGLQKRSRMRGEGNQFEAHTATVCELIIYVCDINILL